MVMTLPPQPPPYSPLLLNPPPVQQLPFFPPIQPMDSIYSLSKSAPSFPATDFVVKPAQNGQPEVRLFDILRKGKPVVLMFYPNETLPYCKQQIAEMREKLRGTNAELIGVSGAMTFLRASDPTTPASPQEQAITLLSDTTGELQRNYRVGSSFWWGLVPTPNRETVVIDPVTYQAEKACSSPGDQKAGLVHVEEARKILDRLAQTAKALPTATHFLG